MVLYKIQPEANYAHIYMLMANTRIDFAFFSLYGINAHWMVRAKEKKWREAPYRGRKKRRIFAFDLNEPNKFDSERTTWPQLNNSPSWIDFYDLNYLWSSKKMDKFVYKILASIWTGRVCLSIVVRWSRKITWSINHHSIIFSWYYPLCLVFSTMW